jgi:hypothetical protein
LTFQNRKLRLRCFPHSDMAVNTNMLNVTRDPTLTLWMSVKRFQSQRLPLQGISSAQKTAVF